MFYKEHSGKPFFEELVNFMISDFIVGIELIADDCVNKWNQLIGPSNCWVNLLFLFIL